MRRGIHQTLSGFRVEMFWRSKQQGGAPRADNREHRPQETFCITGNPEVSQVDISLGGKTLELLDLPIVGDASPGGQKQPQSLLAVGLRCQSAVNLAQSGWLA